MTTVAVIGAAGALGRAVSELLDDDADVHRLLGLDLTEPDMPVAKLDYRAADSSDPLLPQALEGADVVVHLGLRDLERDVDSMHARAVGGTRNVLSACERIGARVLVHVSSASVYGAHSDNPVPMEESGPLRANGDFGYALCHQAAEELVSTWAQTHPDVRVVVLRPAVMLGPGVIGSGVGDFVSRHLLSPVLPLVRGYEPPFQVVHVDDVATAVAMAVSGDLAGAYNVAADGWLAVADLCTLIGRRPVFVPEQVAFSGAAALYERGLLSVPPGALHYVMHPWVLSAAKLHEAGWAAAHSNRETLRRFAADNAGRVTLGRHTARIRDLAMTAVGAVGALVGVVGFAWRRRRRG